MNINGLGFSSTATNFAAKTAKTEEQKAATKVNTTGEEVVQKPKEDSITISKGFYEKNKVSEPDSKLVDQLKADMERQAKEFENFIKSMVTKQGQTSNFSLGDVKLSVTPEDMLKAKSAVDEGGEFSVDAVATRIMDMAMALSGGDKSKIALLKDAVMKGFEAAGVELGSKLPDISNRTYDEIMTRFDKWENGGVE